jgi:hypothetical protein
MGEFYSSNLVSKSTLVAYNVFRMTSNNYGGWYLPSVEELKEIKKNSSTINSATTNNSGTYIQNTNAVSSMDTHPDNALVFDFQNNTSSTMDKSSNLRARGVKRF